MLPLGRGEKVLVVESKRERLLRDEEMLALRRWRAACGRREYYERNAIAARRSCGN
jgi:hypothetical protein